MGSDPRSDEWRYPEGNEDTPPAPAMPDGARPVRREVLAGEAAELLILRIRDADHDTELTTLRQRLAEAEAEKARLVSAMTKENERVAADAARWEGAARIMAKEIKVHRWSVDPGHHEETDEAIRITDQNPTASALVREGGGGA